MRRSGNGRKDRIAYGKKRALSGLAALLLALVLTACGSLPVASTSGEEFSLWGEPITGEEASLSAQAADSGAETVEYGTGETQEAEESRVVTWQELLGTEEASQSAVDYTDPYAWEYCFQYLDEPRQRWYRDIQQTLAGLKLDQELSPAGLEAGLTEEDIDQIFCYVLADHPEYFYVDGYRYTRFSRLDKLVKIEFSGSYVYSEEECAERWARIQEEAEKLLAQAPQGEDDYEKVRYIYETLICNTDYVLDAPDNQNLYSVLVNGASVCQGYAKAAQYLLNHLGIPCVLVQGRVEPGEGHAWNLLLLNGEYYYMDATWGDASYQQTEEQEGDGDWMPQVNYDYLCVTTEQLLRTHVPDQNVPLPECTATRDNYYVREGCLISTLEETALQQAFDRALEAGRQEISLKCTQEEVYRRLLEHLIEEKKVFSYLGQDCSSLHYARNEKQLSVTFWFVTVQP
ncbi:MAG: hypothetical protein J6B43_04995 [Lachnospiraceae bacterium]|nr:hypothetical protein [Lachnospiraceae bacterium]